MNDQDFSIMDETVTKICNSLVTEPEKWKFDIFDIIPPASLGRLSIVKGIQDSFTSVRHSRYSVQSERVFSYNQGQKIRTAYYKALSITGSRKQQEILKQISATFEKPTITSKPAQLVTNSSSCILPWWFLLSAITFFTILLIKGLL